MLHAWNKVEKKKILLVFIYTHDVKTEFILTIIYNRETEKIQYKITVQAPPTPRAIYLPPFNWHRRGGKTVE